MNISLFPVDNDAFFTLDSGTRRYRIGTDVHLRGTQGKISPLEFAFSVQIFSRKTESSEQWQYFRPKWTLVVKSVREAATGSLFFMLPTPRPLLQQNTFLINKNDGASSTSRRMGFQVYVNPEIHWRKTSSTILGQIWSKCY